MILRVTRTLNPMKEKPFVSFIVPVYKAEPYIRQCVDSLLAQTYTDYEIVLVDDGSPDNCPAICDSYAEQDGRIRVIHKANGGLSDARNTGLQNALGEYVIFIDSDDFWLEKDSLGFLVSEIKRKPVDFLGFNGSYYFPESNSLSVFPPYSDKLSNPVSGSTAIYQMTEVGLFQVSACLKVIKREFLIKNDLFFVKGQTAEDIPWFINLLDCCKECAFINHYIYAYRKGLAGSISSQMDEKHFLSLFGIFKTELEKVEGRSFTEEAKDSLRSFLAYEYCILLIYEISKELRKELYSYKQILHYDQHPKVRKASRINKMFGIGVTAWVLKQYQKVRTARMK